MVAESTDLDEPTTFQQELLRLDAELNKTKSLLNDLSLKPWHAHTRRNNPAGTVIQEIRDQTNRHNNGTPELLTQAWCKFTEILNAFALVGRAKEGSQVFKSCHLCEAPGAFITALNHHLHTRDEDFRSMTNRKWVWMATTLHPHYEGHSTNQMINDDRFLLHTMETNWKFGLDTTGNICDRSNLEQLIEVKFLKLRIALVRFSAKLQQSCKILSMCCSLP